MNVYRDCRMFAVLFSALLMSSFALAQEPRSQYDRVKGVEPFIGFWAGEAPEGEGNRLMITCRWAANKSYGQFQIWNRSDDERNHLGTINVGWDGAEKKLALWTFFPDAQAKANPTIDGNTMKWSSQGTTSEGEKTSADVKFAVDGDTLTVEVRNSRRGEEAQPDMTISLKRRQRGERP